MRVKRSATIRGALFAALLCCGWAWSADFGGEAEVSPGASVALPAQNLVIATAIDLAPASAGVSSLGKDVPDLNSLENLPALPSAEAALETTGQSASPASESPRDAMVEAAPTAPAQEAVAAQEGQTLVPERLGALDARRPEAQARDEVSRLAAAVSSPKSGTPGESQGAALEREFDGAAAIQNGAGVPEDVSRGLQAFYPRVVFIEDSFKGPASDKTAASIEKLLDAGVHVVFMTQRPLKGEDSAETALLSRLRNRTTNPLMVVSYGGAKISFLGRAKNPKSLIEDEPGFSAKALSVIRATTERFQKSAPQNAGVSEEILPDAEHPLSYALVVPSAIGETESAAIVKSALSYFNRALAAAKLPYRLRQSPNDSRRLVVSAMTLSASLPRVYRALSEQFAEENLLRKPEQFLVLAAPGSKNGLTARFPASADVQVAKSGEGLDALLGATLKDNQLPGVSVKLGKLRQFVEYWEPKHGQRSDEDREFSGGGSVGPRVPGAADKDFGRYTGGVMNQLLAYLYDQVNKGNHAAAALSAAEARLRRMWYMPLKYGVFVDQGLLKVMHGKSWKARQRGYLEYANSYLINFYLREFHDYSVAAADIRAHLLRLKTDWQSGVAVGFRSAATGREYKIHTRIPRTMWRDTAQGRVLEAYAYRTGKESFGNGEELYAQVLAMALLKGDARMGADGKWHMGAEDGPVVTQLKVQIEYRSGHRTWTFEPSQFLYSDGGAVVQGPVAQKITSSIERMEADEAYGAYYGEQEKGISSTDWNKKKAAVNKAQRAARTKKALALASGKSK